MKNKILFALCAAALTMCITGCKNKQKASGSDQNAVNLAENIFLHVETEPCFGECPVYILTIYQDSTIEYNGKMFTKKVGKFAGKAKAKHIDQLKYALKQSDFFAMDRVYDDTSVTDLPATTISARVGKRVNQVRARYNEPDSFRKLSSFIFEFIDELPLEQVETK